MPAKERQRVLRFLASWPLHALALLIALASVWAVEKLVTARGLEHFQQEISSTAAHLSEGGQKNVVLGAVMAIGRVDASARATAKGTLPPDNPEVARLLEQLDGEFELSNALILNAGGTIVAYHIDQGPAFTGRSLAQRPYFRAAMAGAPNMYAALGSNTGERGLYLAAPIIEKGATVGRPASNTMREAVPAAPGVVGVMVAKLGFDEVDRHLERMSHPVAVVSPEGVVFASNRREWLFRVISDQADLDAIRRDQRAAKAYENAPPQRLAIDPEGWLQDGDTRRKLFSAPIDWRDARGAWRLVGFEDPAHLFKTGERLLVGATAYLIVILFGLWRFAHQRVITRTTELENANRQLAALSTTDSLTGVANRRRFDHALTEEWLRARRNEQPLALLMIDVDHFKSYNDHYGHQQGDACLQAVAAVIRLHAKRVGDLAARYGGEEFCILLANTDIVAAQAIAELLRQDVEGLAIPHDKAPSRRVTISIGVAVMPAQHGSVADPLLESADKALYQAKHGGRNRVVLAEYVDADSQPA